MPAINRREKCCPMSLWSKSNQRFLPKKNKGLDALLGMSLPLRLRRLGAASHFAGCCA
jgi:hypothetical protein